MTVSVNVRLSMDPEGIDAILNPWSIEQPYTIEQVDGGTNNLSRIVYLRDDNFFLRIYQNSADLGRVRHEHAILRSLQHAGLSFAVPNPRLTRVGESFVQLPESAPTYAALFPIIPGEPPRRGDAAIAEICGEALGELDHALARLGPVADSLPKGLEPYGDLDHIHPLVPNPRAIIDRLPIAEESRQHVLRLVENVQSVVPVLYATLPRQLIHGDYGRNNTLVHGNQVTGILDFEFSTVDLRAIDLTAGIFSFCGHALGTGSEWPILERLVTGYLRQCPLTSAEVDVMPMLLRLHQIASVIHRVGRFRQGLASVEEVSERIDRAIQLDQWLDQHTTRIQQLLARPPCA